MQEPRKASDILLTIESELKLIKANIDLQDHLLKSILGNSNKATSILNALIDIQPGLSPEQKASIRGEVQAPKTEIVQAGFPLDVETDFKGQRRVTRGTNPQISTKASNADIEFKDYLAQRKKPAVDEEFKPNPSKQQDQVRKIPITQRVQDNNKKDLFMAEVSLSNENGPVLKTKTNAMGKWQAQLQPGKYTVVVSKMDTASQKKLVAQQDITVTNSNSLISLPILIINRE